MVSVEELEDVLWKEKYKASRKETKKQYKKSRQKIEERQQYYVDNLSSLGDNRSISVIGNEQGEHFWRSAPQMVEYRNGLTTIENAWWWVCMIYMSFWLAIPISLWWFY